MFFSKRHNFLARFLLISGIAFVATPVFSGSQEGKDLEASSVLLSEKLLSEEFLQIHQEEVDRVLAEGIFYSEEERLSNFPDIDSLLNAGETKKIASDLKSPREEVAISRESFPQANTKRTFASVENQSLEKIVLANFLVLCGRNFSSGEDGIRNAFGETEGDSLLSSTEFSAGEPCPFSGIGLSKDNELLTGGRNRLNFGKADGLLLAGKSYFVGDYSPQVPRGLSIEEGPIAMVGTPRGVGILPSSREKWRRGSGELSASSRAILGVKNEREVTIAVCLVGKRIGVKNKLSVPRNYLSNSKNYQPQNEHSIIEVNRLSSSYIFLSFPEPIEI